MTETSTFTQLLAAWQGHIGGREVTAKEVLAISGPGTHFRKLLESAVPHRGRLSSRVLGKWLARNCSDTSAELRLVKVGERCSSIVWAVQPHSPYGCNQQEQTQEM